MQIREIIDEEVAFRGSQLISETDIFGVITYVNRDFCKLMGFSKEELLGQSHSIIRHPDMPDLAFQEMWNRILNGKRWTGYVKNLHKDGKYSWVMIDIISKYDAEGKPTGYIATRRAPGANLIEIKKQYKKYKKFELQQLKPS